jgi:aryl-alcohol dehydrogenase-like predicted oxidoreductase
MNESVAPQAATRRIGGVELPAMGLGCMNLSHVYFPLPSREQAAALLQRALERGVLHFDTAALYGFGSNERLLGEVLAPHRARLYLASKGGMSGIDGKRVIDGRPAAVRRDLENSLRYLRTDYLDLYYLHRWDKAVPIEDTMGELARLVAEGKLRAIGLSEVSVATLRRAHAVHPLTAVQSEYSLWSRNPELGMLDACRELGVAFVAFSPLGRGFLAGALHDPQAQLPAKDLRLGMPRFQPGHWPANLALLAGYRALAEEARCTPAQLALAWLLRKAPHIVPLPGTSNVAHLEENLAAVSVRLDAALVARLEAHVNQHTVSGPRYPDAVLDEVDAEEFPSR